MRRLTWVYVLALAFLCVGTATGEPDCPIVPRPKEYQRLGRNVTLERPGAAAIVVGAKATDPERYAAEYLQIQIQRRFKRRLPICDEKDVPTDVRQMLLLGQVDTNAWLGRLCADHGIDLSSDSPGHDGYILRCLNDGKRQVVLVGGSNPRGVIYGQNSLFDLLRRDGENVVFPAVSVRDWPSIAWRGRPHSVLKQHLVPGALDAYLRARLNFTDVRDDPDVEPTVVFPARKASMGFPAGKPIDKPLVKQMIRESHRRGLFVYGTVSCGVPVDKTDDVIKTFEELIVLGVDGLWISFDDVGAGGNAPNVIRRVLELGARHDMTGRKIAVTPPAGDYQHIDTEFNRQAAGQWGLAQAQWLFTRVPCAEDMQEVRRIGISGLPGWWHNLVNMRGGFLHNGGVLCPLRKDWKPAYVNPQPLANGWHHPSYEQLRDAEKNTDCVMLWGVIGGWPEEYQLGDLGLWAWNPAAHDWNRTCDAAYRIVFGPSQVETARALDEKLSALKDLFHLPPWRFWPSASRSFQGWPCHLKRVQDRARALALLDELDVLSALLNSRAKTQTAIDPNRLETVYLEPIRATLDYARRMTLLDYPEYSASDIQRRMISLLDHGQVQEAQEYLAEVRDRLTPQLARIQKELGELKLIDEYVAEWRQRISGMEYWKEFVVRRRREMTSRFRKLIQGDVASLFPYKEQVDDSQLDALFTKLPNPPAGKALAELDASDWLRTSPWFVGAFCVGRFESKGRELLAVAYPRRIPSMPGDAAEVRALLAVPKYDGRLMLDFFVNDTRLQNRYPGHRYMQLWSGDRLLWEEDIAASRNGKEWISLDITELGPAGSLLGLRFRVVDRRAVGDHLSVTFLGPVRLRVVAGKPSPPE